MKITFVMPWHISERGGGAEVQANYLAQELVLRGYEVSYICQTKTKSKIDTSKVVNGFEIFWLKPSGRFAWLDQNKYHHALSKISPDVVLQRLSSNVTYSIANYCRLNKKIFHWFCTDNEAPFQSFHLKRFTDRHKFRIGSSLKFSVFYLNALIMDYYRNRGMKNISVAWSQNSFQKEQLLQNFKLETNTMITGHPLPVNTFDSEINFNHQTVLWCANLGKHKRPELFIELARRLQHTNIRFVMVGGHSNQEYVNTLFKNKPENLEVMGECSFDEALSFFDHTSILINTSEAEGFSNTYIQAWLRGIPTFVMGADPSHVIANNKLGYNCSSLNLLEEKLQSLLNDKKNFIAMSKQVKNYAEENHSIKVMTDTFLKHLHS